MNLKLQLGQKASSLKTSLSPMRLVRHLRGGSGDVQQNNVQDNSNSRLHVSGLGHHARNAGDSWIMDMELLAAENTRLMRQVSNLQGRVGMYESWMRRTPPFTNSVMYIWDMLVQEYPYLGNKKDKAMNKTTTITRDDNELEVNYDYFPASRGQRENGSGVQISPDEPASVELCKIKLGTVVVTDLLEFLHDGIEEEIINHEPKANG